MAAHDIRTGDMLERALALAEARLGDVTGAAARLEALIERQCALGVAGLMLGVSYEARALVAIWAGEREALRQYAQLTAASYRLTPGSPVRGRYLQLAAEARHAGLEADVSIGERAGGEGPSAATLRALVSSRLHGEASTLERAAAALQLICESAQADGGHLYAILPDGDVTLAASYRASLVPGEIELGYARACLQRAQSEASLTTELMSMSGAASMVSPNAWTGPGGVSQQCLLVTGTRDREARHVAVLLLHNASGHAARLRGLLFAVGERMLADDATLGVIANDG